MFRLLIPLLMLASALAVDPPMRVSATPEALRFAWPARAGAMEIRELPLHTSAAEGEGRVVWSGEGAGATIPRFDGLRDRLFAKFELRADGQPLGEPQHVTDFGVLPRRTHPLGSRASKKGVGALIGIDDGMALGLKQASLNIAMNGLLDLGDAKPKLSFDYEGRTIGLRPAAVARLDADLLEMHRAGIRVTGILLNLVNKPTPRTSPLVHPLCDPATVPIGPAAFNTATAEGVFHFRAFLHWLVERYTRPGAPFGQLGGLVIGNEVQSHWTWYHLGKVEPDVVIREYTAALRVADLATRRVHADFPIYVSLEHHWTMPASKDRQMGFSGVEVLEGVNARAKREGDFPWHLAHHPYPENLFQPRFWNDKTAPLRFDAPRLTFHNLEVLPAFMRQPRFLFAGRPRRIALTEQGFHCGDKSGDEEAQAAAFALAWKKVQALPDIESFLYHRHVDHPHEHGLHCGLRDHDGSPNILGVGRARKIWDVVQKAGTPEEDTAFAFALPIVGRKNWSNVVATKFDPPRPVRREPGRVVFDFVAQRATAQQENVQAVELRRIGPADEVQQDALQQHPKPKERGLLTYRVAIPAADAERCLLVFDALLNDAKSNGAAFAVEIDGREVFARQLKGTERVPAEIDLADFRGREVSIAFIVDALADPAYDWATWVAPRVVLR
ncbi:MAG: DUF5722 domain-containing protein [Chthoniobacteraceae bacterium]